MNENFVIDTTFFFFSKMFFEASFNEVIVGDICNFLLELTDKEAYPAVVLSLFLYIYQAEPNVNDQIVFLYANYWGKLLTCYIIIVSCWQNIMLTAMRVISYSYRSQYLWFNKDLISTLAVYLWICGYTYISINYYSH